MSALDRKTRADLFVRVCRDSGFGLPTTTAAQIAARVLGVHPIQVWDAVGSLDVMQRIARGDHPACKRTDL